MDFGSFNDALSGAAAAAADGDAVADEIAAFRFLDDLLTEPSPRIVRLLRKLALRDDLASRPPSEEEPRAELRVARTAALDVFLIKAMMLRNGFGLHVDD